MFPKPALTRRGALAVFILLLAACRAPTSVLPSSTNTPEPPTTTATRMPSATTTPTATTTATNTPTVSPSPTPTSTPTRTPTPTPYPPERLAFAIGPFDSPAIAFINSDGTDFERADYFGPYLYVNTESQSHMTGDFLNFSPDGRYLAFDGSELAEIESVYLADLSQGKVIGSIPNSRGFPFSWSPDSRYLVVSGYVYEQYSRNLILYDVETGQSKQLTEGNAARYFPSWSPDSQWITFMQVTDSYPVYPCVDLGEGCDGLYIIHPDGSGLRFLTGDVAFSYMDFPYYFAWTPPWSPDSQWLSIITLSNHENVIVNVTNGEIQGYNINNWDKMAWTPDGHLYTILSPSGNADIFTMLPAGGEQTNLTNSPGNEFWPSWSPSGHFVAFYYNYQEQNYLCVMNADGSSRRCFKGITGKRIAWLPAGRP